MIKYAKNSRQLTKFLLFITYALVLTVAVLSTAVAQQVKYTKQINTIITEHEEELVALRIELQDKYEQRILEIEQYYEYGGDVDLIEKEAEYIAKVIYGTAKNHADSDKRAVVWCILNRVEHYAYADTVKEVCEQQKQWMGYSEENPVLTDNFELALAELKIWHSNDHRPVSDEYIYLSWSSKEILLRDTFEENKNTHYWRMR